MPVTHTYQVLCNRFLDHLLLERVSPRIFLFYQRRGFFRVLIRAGTVLRRRSSPQKQLLPVRHFLFLRSLQLLRVKLLKIDMNVAPRQAVGVASRLHAGGAPPLLGELVLLGQVLRMLCGHLGHAFHGGGSAGSDVVRSADLQELRVLQHSDGEVRAVLRLLEVDAVRGAVDAGRAQVLGQRRLDTWRKDNNIHNNTLRKKTFISISSA